MFYFSNLPQEKKCQFLANCSIIKGNMKKKITSAGSIFTPNIFHSSYENFCKILRCSCYLRVYINSVL